MIATLRTPPAIRRMWSLRSPDDADASNGDADPSDDGADPAEDGGTPRTMAADNERESVSEPADGAGEAEEKPKRRRTSRPRAKAKKDADEGSAEATAVANVETAEAVSAPATTEEEAPKPKRRRRTKKADEAAGAETQDAAPAAEEAEKGADAAKPKRRTRRSAKKVEPDEPSSTDQLEAKADAPVEAPAQNGKESEEAEEAKPKRARRSRAKKAPEKTPESAPEGDGDEGETAAEDEVLDDDEVESVGTDDALEEVPTRRVSRRNYKIQEVIKRRQIMLVQVVKEERGNKGAALTTYLSLAGRYSVLMPNTARGGGISRKITSAGDRKKLKEIASSLEVTPGMGVILRTAGASRTEQEITRDFEYLLRLWENVRTLTLKSTAPCLVYEEGSLIKRSIRDLYSKEMSEILVAGARGLRGGARLPVHAGARPGQERETLRGHRAALREDGRGSATRPHAPAAGDAEVRRLPRHQPDRGSRRHRRELRQVDAAALDRGNGDADKPGGRRRGWPASCGCATSPASSSSTSSTWTTGATTAPSRSG